ncbi:hypothetical protein AC1031_016121 [Aphanomyces cochlioides]|nr:hypothetical protein AC1031_016121 [Aphanomyces cochlioides]
MLPGSANVYWDHFDVMEPEEEWSVEMRLLRKPSPIKPHDEVYDAFQVKPKSKLERLKFWQRGNDGNEELVLLQPQPSPVDGNFHEQPHQATWHWLAITLLLTSFGAVSSLGVAFTLQVGVSPMLKLFWKVSSTLLVSTVLAGLSVYHRGWPSVCNFANTTLRIVLCAAGYTLWNVSFNWALDHTSLGHVYLFNNSHSLLIVVLKAVTAQHVDVWEVVGMIIGISGSAITAMDDSTSTNLHAPTLGGDIGAFIGAFGAVLYLFHAKTIQARLDNIFVFMWCHSFTVSILLIASMWFFGEPFELSFDPAVGLFGWATPGWTRWPLELYLVGICDFVGGLGYVRVMQYVEPIVVSITMLMEPLMATFLGILVGISSIPGPLTLIGSSIVIAGTVMVVSVKTKSPKDDEDEEDKLHRDALPTLQPRRPVNYGAVVV